MFFATAAKSLSTVQGALEELSVAAEGEYRYVAHPSSLPHVFSYLRIVFSYNPTGSRAITRSAALYLA